MDKSILQLPAPQEKTSPESPSLNGMPLGRVGTCYNNGYTNIEQAFFDPNGKIRQVKVIKHPESEMVANLHVKFQSGKSRISAEEAGPILQNVNEEILKHLEENVITQYQLQDFLQQAQGKKINEINVMLGGIKGNHGILPPVEIKQTVKALRQDGKRIEQPGKYAKWVISLGNPQPIATTTKYRGMQAQYSITNIHIMLRDVVNCDNQNNIISTARHLIVKFNISVDLPFSISRTHDNPKDPRNKKFELTNGPLRGRRVSIAKVLGESMFNVKMQQMPRPGDFINSNGDPIPNKRPPSKSGYSTVTGTIISYREYQSKTTAPKMTTNGKNEAPKQTITNRKISWAEVTKSGI